MFVRFHGVKGVFRSIVRERLLLPRLAMVSPPPVLSN